MTRIFVPRASGALAVGAEPVARAIAREAEARNIPVEIVRTGSRGLYWLEPMIEVEISTGRVAYGPVAAADVASLFEADFLSGGAHTKQLGSAPPIPFLAPQAPLHLSP